MKKRFCPLSASAIGCLIIYFIVFLALIAFFIYSIVISYTVLDYIAVFIFSLPCVGVGFALIFLFLYKGVIFLEDKIIAKGSKSKNPYVAIQYEVEIYYKDILDVKIVISKNQNSLKKWYKQASGFSSTAYNKPFFNFILKDGETKWVWIELYSIKQRKKMLQIINEKTGLNIDYDDIFANREEVDVGRPYRMY